MSITQQLSGPKSSAHFYKIWYISDSKSTYAVIINPTTHQTIIVTNDGVEHRKSFLAKANSTYTVDVVPDEGYLAGTLNTTGGTVTSDISITVTSATMDPKYESYTLTIIQSDNQTITVICNHNTYTDTFKDKKGSSYIASIDSVAGYIPGTLSSTSGTLDSDTTISATAAEAVDLVGYAPKHITNYATITAIPDENMAYINKAIPHAINVSGMLSGCEKLQKVDTTRWDTSNAIYMSGMFNYCSSLTSLDLSNFNTSNVTNMGGMFNYCSSLATLDLSSFDTSKVIDMRGMFEYCSSLTSLDLSNFNTSNVTDMSGMFNVCSSLTSLDLSNFNTSNVTNMGGMFEYCYSLTSLDLSNFNTSNVISMFCMFYDCSSLATLDLSSFDTSNVTDMRSMFHNCSGLTTIKGIIDMKSCKKYTDMFKNCTKLTGVKIKNPPSDFASKTGLSASQYTVVTA